MNNLKHNLGMFSIVASAVLGGVLAITGMVSASTTIGTNITTAGNLSVSGSSTLTDLISTGSTTLISATIQNLMVSTMLGSSDSLVISTGGNAASTDDTSILVHRAAVNPLSNGGSHALRDESTYNPGNASGGYSSFDSIYTFNGGISPNNHAHSYQSRIDYNSAANLNELAGFTEQATHSGTGTIGVVYGLRMMDALGTGPITTQTGLFCDNLTRGSSNYCVYSGLNGAYFGGTIQGGGLIQGVTGKFTGLGTTYGAVVSHDASGNLIDNPNFTVINGVVTSSNSTTNAYKFGGATSNYPMLTQIGSALALQRADGTIGTFSTLYTCQAGRQGMMANITDSTTNAWGATITGGGSYSVLAYCDGANWTVMAK